MVEPTWWEVQRQKAIALTKMRIKHCEKHGMGDTAIREKRILQKQERHHQLLKDKKP